MDVAAFYREIMSNADSYREEIEADVHIDLYGTLKTMINIFT